MSVTEQDIVSQMSGTIPRTIGFDTETMDIPYTRQGHKRKCATFICFSYYAGRIRSPDQEGSGEQEFQGTSFDRKSLVAFFSCLYSHRSNKHINFVPKIFCHNLEFDLNVIDPILQKYRFFIERDYNDSQIIRATMKLNDTVICRFYDCMNYYPMSLERLGESLGIPKYEHPNYLGKRMPNEQEKTYFESYALQDSIIVYNAMNFLMTTLGMNPHNLKSTIAGVAFQKLNENCDYLYHSIKTDNIQRDLQKGYFGGMVTAFWRGIRHAKKGEIYLIDVNSLYPYIMAHGEFPDISQPYSVVKNINPERIGMAKVRITIPENTYCPCLPVRTSIDDTDKLIFPTGTIDGIWTYAEIQYALKQGATLENIEYAYEWKKLKESPFKEYTLMLYEQRKQAKANNDCKELVYKLMMNSSYGKFGEKCCMTVIKAFYDIPLTQLDGWVIITPNVFKQMKIPPNALALKTSPEQLTKHTRFEVASQITAQARLVLISMIKKLKKQGCEILYCDTDSILFEGKLPDEDISSSELGKWKLENTYEWAIPIRSKFYITPDKIKIKGVHITKKQREKGQHMTNTINLFKKKLKAGDMRCNYWTFTKLRGSVRQALKPNTRLINRKYIITTTDGKRNYNEEITTKELTKKGTGSKAINFDLKACRS